MLGTLLQSININRIDAQQCRTIYNRLYNVHHMFTVSHMWQQHMYHARPIDISNTAGYFIGRAIQWTCTMHTHAMPCHAMQKPINCLMNLHTRGQCIGNQPICSYSNAFTSYEINKDLIKTNPYTQIKSAIQHCTNWTTQAFANGIFAIFIVYQTYGNGFTEGV